MDSNDPDFVQLQGAVIALTVTLREILRQAQDEDPEAYGRLRLRVTDKIKQQKVRDQLISVAGAYADERLIRR